MKGANKSNDSALSDPRLLPAPIYQQKVPDTLKEKMSLWCMGSILSIFSKFVNVKRYKWLVLHWSPNVMGSKTNELIFPCSCTHLWQLRTIRTNVTTQKGRCHGQCGAETSVILIMFVAVGIDMLLHKFYFLDHKNNTLTLVQIMCNIISQSSVQLVYKTMISYKYHYIYVWWPQFTMRQ